MTGDLSRHKKKFLSSNERKRGSKEGGGGFVFYQTRCTPPIRNN